MAKFVIDGRQLLNSQTGGVQRFIKEVCLELDKIVNEDEFEILIPNDERISLEFENIKIKNFGYSKGLLWEQIDLPYYLFTRKKYGIFLCTIVPFLYPHGIATVHDVMVKKLPELRKAIQNPFARCLLLANNWIAVKCSNYVMTVSNCSKKDIVENYNVNPDKIFVTCSAWQHIKNITFNDGWMERYPNIIPGEFYFSLSANRKQKNFKWIYEIAKKYPDRIFAIAGCREEWQKDLEIFAPNIIHLGYISDGEVLSLMKTCKAFLFPSYYEGFGLPPLEALSVGAKVVIGNRASLPEVYEDAAYYIEPFDYDVDLDDLLSHKVAPPEKILNKYSWANVARDYYELCKKLM